MDCLRIYYREFSYVLEEFYAFLKISKTEFPNDEEEYYQIHVDVLYMPAAGNKDFEQSTWNEDIEENIFSYVKKSREFDFCKNKEFSKVEIYLDAT